MLAENNGRMGVFCMTNVFCFIACVNDEELYKESLFYINQLDIPQGFFIECRAVRNAQSITEGYNAAMRESDAKYKIYMHQDVFILNKRFLFDLLDIFLSDETIGIVGVVGSGDIPEDGVWWETADMLGYVYDALAARTTLVNEKNPENKYGYAKLVDGLLLATQYDLPWREDIFSGWHFYDVSQCCEFLRKKYKVFVASQCNSEGVVEPWCLHYVGTPLNMIYYEKYRSTFRNEYRDLLVDNDSGGTYDKHPEAGISIVLPVGDYIDAVWERMGEFDRHMSKDGYELILVVNQLDGKTQKLLEQEGIKIIFAEPDKGAASYLNNAIAIAEPLYDVILLDCRISVSGSFSLAMQRALYNAQDAGAAYCAPGEPLPEIWASSNKLEGLTVLFKRTALDYTGAFDESFSTISYALYDYAVRLINDGYKLIKRNIANFVFPTIDNANALQIDKLKFEEKMELEPP